MFYLKILFWLIPYFLISPFGIAGECFTNKEGQYICVTTEEDVKKMMEAQEKRLKQHQELMKLPMEERLKILYPYPGVVKLSAVSQNELGTGTGFFITPEILVTAYHVVYDHDNKEMRKFYFRPRPSGNPVFLKTLISDSKHDLVLLKAENYKSEHFYSIDPLKKTKNDEQAASLYKKEWGNPVIIPGFPMGLFSIAEGPIIGYTNYRLHVEMRK